MPRKRMTEAAAIAALIDAASKHMGGVGCGIRSLPGEIERTRIEQAIRRLWPKAYDWPLSETEAIRYGLRDVEPAPAKPEPMIGPQSPTIGDQGQVVTSRPEPFQPTGPEDRKPTL